MKVLSFSQHFAGDTGFIYDFTAELNAASMEKIQKSLKLEQTLYLHPSSVPYTKDDAKLQKAKDRQDALDKLTEYDKQILGLDK